MVVVAVVEEHVAHPGAAVEDVRHNCSPYLQEDNVLVGHDNTVAAAAALPDVEEVVHASYPLTHR